MSDQSLDIVRWACIKCRDPEFQMVVGVQFKCKVPDEQTCKQIVLDFCGITSRKELATNAKAAGLFRDGFIKPYQLYKRRREAA